MSLLVVILVIQNRCIYYLEKVCNRDTWSTAHFVEKVLVEHSHAICTQTVCIYFPGTTDWEATKLAMLVSLWFTKKNLLIPEL